MPGTVNPFTAYKRRETGVTNECTRQLEDEQIFRSSGWPNIASLIRVPASPNSITQHEFEALRAQIRNADPASLEKIQRWNKL